MDALFFVHLLLASLYIWLATPKFRINSATFAPLVMVAAYTNFLLAIPLGVQAHLANRWQSDKTKIQSPDLRSQLIETTVVLIVSISAWLLPFGILPWLVSISPFFLHLFFPLSTFAIAVMIGKYHHRAVYNISIKALTSIFLIYFMLAGRIPWQESTWSIAAVTTAVSAGILLLSRFLPSVRATLLLPNVKEFMVLNFLVLVPICGTHHSGGAASAGRAASKRHSCRPLRNFVTGRCRIPLFC